MSGEQHDLYVLELEGSNAELLEAGKALLKQCQVYAISAWSLTEDNVQRTAISKQFSADADAWHAVAQRAEEVK